MKFDFYADFTSSQACPTSGPLPCGLASGFVDGCTAFAARGNDAKNEARRCYSQHAASGELKLPSVLGLDVAIARPLREGWLVIDIAFALCAPWYSKDDRPFHVLDNPVRKDPVFGVPFMSAASWKGLLRWACRMRAGLCEFLEKRGGCIDGWNDPPWIIHLFGNEKAKANEFQRGALAFYPTWFSKVGFEVINPHSRKTRAGTQPILYEVVPADTNGMLRLLYAPVPGAAARDSAQQPEALSQFLDAAEQLLTVYGFSAKRTAGWGVAKIEHIKAIGLTRENGGNLEDVKKALGELLAAEEMS